MITVFGSAKGGVGKSTLLANLAIIRRTKGKKVLVIDGDPQETIQLFASRRIAAKHEPRLQYAVQRGEGITQQLEAFYEDYDDILVDTRGADSEELRAALLVADIFISPVQPSQADIETLVLIDPIVKNTVRYNKTLRNLIVTNMASTHPAATTADDMAAFCEDLPNLKLATTIIRMRQVFKDAHLAGKSVIEMTGGESGDKARKEILQLEAEIWGDE